MTGQLCACQCGQTAKPGNRFVHGHNNRTPLRARVFDRLILSDTGCLLWTGQVHSGGYGVVSFADQRLYVHRLMYEWFVGAIPQDYQIDHLCRVRRCGSPAHLEAVTQLENIRRGDSPTARQHLQTHCIRGHEFTPDNTYVRHDRPSGGRMCRTCQRERWRSSHAA